MRFRAWATTEADGRTRLVVSRFVDGGMRVGAAAVDRVLDGEEEADDVLAAAGWVRTGPWWLVPSGAAAGVEPVACEQPRDGAPTRLAACGE